MNDDRDFVYGLLQTFTEHTRFFVCKVLHGQDAQLRKLGKLGKLGKVGIFNDVPPIGARLFCLSPSTGAKKETENGKRRKM